MKESIGSTVMLGIFMAFFVIYIAFFAIAINYASTFQTKNQVITSLEKYQGYNADSQREIEKYFSNKKIKNGCNLVTDTEIGGKYKGYRCEIKENNISNGQYYNVVVYVQFTMPLINKTVNFPIKGETKTINYVDEIEIEKAPVTEKE